MILKIRYRSSLVLPGGAGSKICQLGGAGLHCGGTASWRRLKCQILKRRASFMGVRELAVNLQKSPGASERAGMSTSVSISQREQFQSTGVLRDAAPPCPVHAHAHARSSSATRTNVTIHHPHPFVSSSWRPAWYSDPLNSKDTRMFSAAVCPVIPRSYCGTVDSQQMLTGSH